MQKIDVYNHKGFYEKWENQLTPKYIEEGLTKPNSILFVKYVKDLARNNSIGYANRNRSKIKGIVLGMQRKGIKDITKANIKEIEDYFYELKEQGYSDDYSKRWNAFYNWYKQINRREGIVVPDLTLILKNFRKKENSESVFVWLTKEQFDNFRSYFDEDKQTILLFAFDSLIRFPTEILSLKVEDIFEKKGEVWVNIPTEISKTIGRKFNLVYSGELIKDYIKRHNKKLNDYLFEFNPIMFNREMQKIAKQLWGDKKSEGGEFYKAITGYDLRHSGSIHFRQLFQKTGQSLDLLRERGGWNNFDMINYYTKRLGLDGHIQKEKLLLEEDKTKIENELEELKFKTNLIEEFLKKITTPEELDDWIPLENHIQKLKPSRKLKTIQKY